MIAKVKHLRLLYLHPTDPLMLNVVGNGLVELELSSLVRLSVFQSALMTLKKGYHPSDMSK